MANTAAASTPQSSLQQADAGYDVARVRRDFPVLSREVHGQPLAYLDNAATSQTPEPVVEAIARYYHTCNSNVHRGVHTLSQEATEQYEAAREACARFIGANVGCEIVFTRGATEAINLVANSYGRQHVGAGDEVLITHLEHHANIVPWQMLCEQTGATLRVAPVTDEGEVDPDAFRALLSPRTRIVALNYVSNTLGTINPVAEFTQWAHDAGAVVLVDGAQATPHKRVNVREIGCDFFVTSGHKMYGPTGIGFLWGRAPLLESMPPWQGGGDMILSVTFEKTTYNRAPMRFEAGTPNIAGAIALAEAIRYIEALGPEHIAAHEDALLRYGTEQLNAIAGVRIIGTAAQKAAVISFVMDSAHPHDIGQILNDAGVAVRAGHHCTQPLMQRFGVPATTRASFGLYNTFEEVDRLVAAVQEVNEVFGG